MVNGKKERNAFFLCFCKKFGSEFKFIFFAKGNADIMAFCFKEGVCHCAADDKGINFFEKVGDYADFIGNFCAAKNSNERSYGVIKSFAHNVDFLLDKEAANSGNVICNAGGGSMCSVGGAECIVYENFSKGSKFFCEFGCVFGFFFIITNVFKKGNFTFFKGCGNIFCVFADDVFAHSYFAAEKFGKSCCNGSKREFRKPFTFRSSKMGAEDYLCAVIFEVFDGGECCNDSFIVGDDAFFKRYVEIAADKNFFAGHFDVFYGHFVCGVHVENILSMVKIF